MFKHKAFMTIALTLAWLPGSVTVALAATGDITRVSVASDGTPGNSYSYSPSISSDGRYIAFNSSANNLGVGDTNGTYDVFVHDRVTQQTTRVSIDSNRIQGNRYST